MKKNTFPSKEILYKLKQRFETLYPENDAQLLVERVEMLASRFEIAKGVRRKINCLRASPRGMKFLQETIPLRKGRGMKPHSVGFEKWDQEDVLLITYSDMVKRAGEQPLKTLNSFSQKNFSDLFNSIHLLPFHPSSSDAGFAVMDYRSIDPAFGSWQDLLEIGKKFNLSVDLVLNHVSRKSAWFGDYLRGATPGKNYFIEVEAGTDLSAVVRARDTPLLSSTQTFQGERFVWTTFSEDQIDVNYSSPDLLFEFLDLFLFYISMGAKMIRLDALAYLWKKIGTDCILLPETHEIAKIFRGIVELLAPDVLLVTETNVPHFENTNYLGQGDEVHLIYQVNLPSLILYALRYGNSQILTEWAQSLPVLPPNSTSLNLTASQDGINVRPLERILPRDGWNRFLDEIQEIGGLVSAKKDDKGTLTPYEINLTYFEALKEKNNKDPEAHIKRFLCSQIIVLELKGIPAIYFNSLIGAFNDFEEVKKTRHPRDINRRKWSVHELEKLLQDDCTISGKIYRRYRHAIKIRKEQHAFHPDGRQEVLNLTDQVFALLRISPDLSERILAINNLVNDPVDLEGGNHMLPILKSSLCRDLLSNSDYDLSKGRISLAPYQTVWLTPA